MPIYEFRCRACKARTSLFVRSVSSSMESPPCDRCGSADLARIFSRVAVHRGNEALDFSESSLADIDENDPRSMARWVRKMSEQMGEPLDAEMENDLERMESGEMPADDGDAADDFAGVD